MCVCVHVCVYTRVFWGFRSVTVAYGSVALRLSQDSAAATEVPVFVQSCCIFLKIRTVVGFHRQRLTLDLRDPVCARESIRFVFIIIIII